MHPRLDNNSSIESKGNIDIQGVKAFPTEVRRFVADITIHSRLSETPFLDWDQDFKYQPRYWDVDKVSAGQAFRSKCLTDALLELHEGITRFFTHCDSLMFAILILHIVSSFWNS